MSNQRYEALVVQERYVTLQFDDDDINVGETLEQAAIRLAKEADDWAVEPKAYDAEELRIYDEYHSGRRYRLATHLERTEPKDPSCPTSPETAPTSPPSAMPNQSSPAS